MPQTDSRPSPSAEVLARYGNKEQQAKWLKPLMEGKIRSSFAMTEHGVASSDATNIRTSIVLDEKTNEIVINGHKWWISGAGDPRNKVHLVMGKSCVALVPLFSSSRSIVALKPVVALQGPEGEQVQAAEHRHRPERHPGRQARPPDAGRASSSLFPSPCRPPRCSCCFVAPAQVDLQSDPTDSSPSSSSPRSSAMTTRPRVTTRSCTRTFASRRRT